MTLWGLPSLPGKVMSAVAYLAGGAALAAWATEIGSAPPARAMPTTAANVAARLASFLGIIAPMRRSGRSRGRGLFNGGGFV